MFNSDSKTSLPEKLLIAVLAIAPLGILTIKGWPGYLLGIAFLLSLLIIFQNRHNQSITPLNNWAKVVFVMLLSPIIGIFISQLLRQDWIIRSYDSPSRFLLALPIFWVLYQKKLSPTNWWKITIPLSLISIPIITPFLPQTGWATIDSSRFAIYFIDPLTFGRIALSMSCLSFVSIAFTNKKHWPIMMLQLLGGMIGIYYSIKSGSRTGWLAAPILIFIFIFIFTFKNKLLSLMTALFITTIVSLFAYQNSDTVRLRTIQAIEDVAKYKIGQPSMENETSVGLRLSFIQMGWHYFIKAPLTGYDDKGFETIMLSSEANLKIHSDFAKQFALTAGFHNEFITNTVRAGIWGSIYTLLLLLTPLAVATTLIRKDSKNYIALVGLTYTINEIISSLSTEVFNLKFTAAFYALLISCILAQSIHQLGSRHESQ